MTYIFFRNNNFTVGKDKLSDNLSMSYPGDLKYPTEGRWFQSSFNPKETLTEVDKLQIEEAMDLAKVKYGKAFEKLAEE